jgi:hypothetical protein
MTTTDLYSTHLPFLEKIFSLIEKPNLVIEFGMGNYSTEFFIKNSNKVESIEMQSKEWYDNMYEKFKVHTNWSPFMFIGPDEYKKHIFLKPDLCFVDGHGDSRPECVNLMIDLGCPIIIAHDTETESYGWGRVDLKNYKKYDFKKFDVWSSVWTINENIINNL